MSGRVEDCLALRPLSDPAGGPPVAPLRLLAPGPYVVGRASGVSWQIHDPTVSRRHATLELIAGEWFVSDLGSRQGTRVNGRLIGAEERVPLAHGDRVTLGGWSCRCDGGSPGSGELTTSLGIHDDVQRVSRLSHASLGGLAQVRLGALLDICRTLGGIEDRHEIAEVVARSAAAGAGCERAIVVRQLSEQQYEILASTTPGRAPDISRTLIAEAARGEPAVLAGQVELAGRPAHSVLDLNIRSAFCAPIVVGGGVEAYLYLDTRGSERALQSDALSFCGALAQLAGMALERGMQRELEERRLRLERDLAVARRAQELLMPERRGALGGVRYAFESLAGRFVAGDLFDVVELPNGRVAFFLGDVSGKGVGAAMLMAATQSHLRSLLLSGSDLAGAVERVNRHLHQRTDPGMFITLIAGVLDAARSVVELVDAGHGMCCIASPQHGAQVLTIDGGLPLAISGDSVYPAATQPLQRGDRLIVFTDGLVEQPGAGGAALGRDAALGVLARTGTPDEDVHSLLDAVQTHAAGALADDLTIASFAFESP